MLDRTCGQHLDCSIERRRDEGFVGREDILAELDRWLLGEEPDRCVVVTGGPGMGKTAILAAWLVRCQAARVAVAHHFVRRGRYGWNGPSAIARSIAAQIEDRWPAHRDPDARPEARLVELLARVSARELAPSGGRLVLLVDGLDECDGPAEVYDPLAAALPEALPRGVRLLCAGRPRHPHLDAFEARHGELVRIDLDHPSAAEDNDATVRAFWRREAQRLGLDDRFVERAVVRAYGNMQHATLLRTHLACMPRPLRGAEDIPRGLPDLLAMLWQRVAGDPLAVRGLGILCAAREPLSLHEIGLAAGWSGLAEQRAFAYVARELIAKLRRGEGVDEYRLDHDAVRAYLVEQLGPGAIRGHHEALARRLATWPAPGGAAARRYALRHALAHRAEAGDWPAVRATAWEVDFLAAKCRELGVDDVEADVTCAAERCRAAGDTAIGRALGDLARALARASRQLRDDPTTLAAQLGNCLRRRGRRPEELDPCGPMCSGDTEVVPVRDAMSQASPAPSRDLAGHGGAVTACAVTPDGRRVVSASTDGTLRVWDLDTGHVLATLEGHTGRVASCAVTPDGRRVVSASADRTLRVWDLDTGHVLATLEGHAGRVASCAVTPDGRRVVSASADRTLRVWDLDTGHVLATLEGHAGRVASCAVTPDGRRVVSTSGDATLRVWELDSGRVLTTLEGHTEVVSGCAITPDGRRSVSASGDHTLKIWDLDTGDLITTLEGHTEWVTSCAIAPDGRRLVSASSDTTLKIWDLDSGRVLATLEGHAGGVASCAIGPDGRHPISGSSDRTLEVWDAGGVRAPADADGPGTRSSGITPEARPADARPVRRAPRRPSSRRVILFLAANPNHADGRLLLDEECAAIERELQLSAHGGDFEFRSKWAVTADEMARHLFKLEPTIVHFSGHGAGGALGRSAAGARDVVESGGAGIYLQDDQGRPQLVPAPALAGMIASSAPSTRVVVLNTCYSDRYAEALYGVVECVVGMAGAIHDAAARSFAVGFYRALGYRRSVGEAVDHGRWMVAAKHELPDEGVPRCRTRNWVGADQIVL